MRRQAGFTLIELMVTMAVAVIVLGAGLPQMQALLENNRLSAQANRLSADLNLARTEAVRRGGTVRMVARGSDWSAGWSLVDADGVVVKVGDQLEHGLALTERNGLTEVGLRNSGALTVLTTAAFELCGPRTGERGREISVLPTGRVGVRNLTCN